ncbi:heavy metal translocating P-type ATPase [Candidatus Curtissbacteria bacterium]|nr:heavy metal translocating P-type ATPase [Candidatus Curtissbacteria bacterium]
MKIYTCPMHPEVQSDKPGRCPKCGMDLVTVGDQGDEDHKGHENHHADMEQDFKRRFFITLPLVIATILLSENIQKWLGIKIDFAGRQTALFLLGTFIFTFGGLPFFKGAKGEIISRNFGMMTLVALAITVGYTFSVAATFLFPGESLYWEISTLISVFLFGHWLEMRAVRGTTGALAELARLIPATAHRLTGKRQEDVGTEKIQKGDKVLVKPGEKIPVDGVVTAGQSSVNESMITGESRPQDVQKGANVIGGSINGEGSLTVQVKKTGAETALSQIMELVRNAQVSKPRVQELADKAANALTLIAIIVGTLTFIIWLFVFPQGPIFAATLAVAVVVVACPHALGLAIPTVTTITSTLGAKNGILIRDMKGLEIARKIDYVIFDKTGTLTSGEFTVAEIITIDKKVNSQHLLSLAAAVESHSGHSLAQGIVNEARAKKIKIQKVTNFKSFPGKGAQGKVGRDIIFVGNAKMMEQIGIESGLLKKIKTRKTGTIIFVSVGKTLLGALVLSDLVRDESKDAIGKLHKLGIRTAILTGDRQDIAREVGKKLGIDTIFAQVLPEDKVRKVKQLQEEGHVVAMVGDGVNDAPSLTQSHLGIAIGAGTDVAVQSAEIVLMHNDPRDVVKAINLSRKTNSKMTQNLIWATGYNVLAIPTAAGLFFKPLGILLRPEWAALLMSASAIIVVANALLLRQETLQD